MISHPTAAELTEAVRRFLDEQAAPKLEGRDAFLAKVAANALAAVERELQQSPAAEAAARGRLATLLGHEGTFEALNLELCEKLEAGEFDLTTPGVLAHLKASTIDQVRIDQPGYSGLAHLTGERLMDFDLPAALTAYLGELDAFIEAKIKPLQASDDNERFFDHRREWARTDWDRGGLPRQEWEDLLKECRRLADEAGHYRYGWPSSMGGRDGTQLDLAVIREHLAAKGLGLFNDLQNEHSIVGNNPFVHLFKAFATPDQYARDGAALLDGSMKVAFGLTEPHHGSDATFMETRGVRETRDGKPGWRIDGEKMWITGMHTATHCMVFARTSGEDGDARGITCFVVPSALIKIEEWLWTFNMPTDHPRLSLTDVWIPEDSYWGEIDKGLAIGQSFVHQNRIRQAASSLGAAVYCINESVAYARERKPFGKALAENQAIQWPLVELATQCEMLRQLIRKTAWEMDRLDHKAIERELGDKVSMCNYWANRLVCEAADRAMQVHGGIGYSRHKPFEHIYRHHRRYRITEGSEEIQMRKVAGYLFGYMGPNKR